MWLGHRAYIELADGATVDYTGGPRPSSATATATSPSTRSASPTRPARARPDRRDGPAGRSPLDRPGDSRPLLARYREVEADDPRADPRAWRSPTARARTTRVHIRGSTEDPRRRSSRAGSSKCSPGRSGPRRPTGSGRLELARRIVDPANPLTARVMVNRLWKHHFGEGIVRTPDDFGVMGSRRRTPSCSTGWPSGSSRDGWSLKAMHRLIVLSRAYRMSSRLDPGGRRGSTRPTGCCTG